jgi:phosphatidylserine/phosphatidylglycerophosphate/cardiolipin synthase-like enzyme
MDDKWLKLFKDATRSKADFLLDGAAYYESVIQAIEAADSSEHYVYILGWMLEVDFKLVENDASKTLYEVLKKATDRGVEIRILIWDNLLPDYTKSFQDAVDRLNKLPNAKAVVDEHTFFPEAGKRYLRQFGPSIKKAILKIGDVLGDFRPDAAPQFAAVEINGLSVNLILFRLFIFMNAPTVGAHHEKVVIVKNSKGLVGFCGGIDFNSGRVMTKVKGRTYWFSGIHDNACRLEGPAAHELLQRFKRRWHHHPIADRTPLRGENEPRPASKPAPYPYAKVVGTFNSSDGKVKDRSLRDAYMKIIENAETYIYIEDQYLVNVDVAKALNRKIKQSRFLVLLLAIQDSIATSDIFIANRKRGEFLAALLDGASESEQRKVVLAVFDRSRFEREKYHPGMHAKTLIVDDEIAIIGSANVNLRSFTNDSETSVIVFDDTNKVDGNFARTFRIKTWHEFLRRKTEPRITYESPYNFPMEISGRSPVSVAGGNKDFSILVKYEQDNLDDADERISRLLKDSSIAGVMVAGAVTKYDLERTTEALSEWTIRGIFDQAWDNVIEPRAPD